MQESTTLKKYISLIEVQQLFDGGGSTKRQNSRYG